MKNQTLDLAIIGGGIMGLMTAYYASLFGKKVAIFEKRYVGNKEAASFSLTRSIRNDYLDSRYARLAQEARELWEKIQEKSSKDFIVNCGCLNLAKQSLTPNIGQTYAAKSYKTISSIGIVSKQFTKRKLKTQFPQFDADYGALDEKAGFLYLPQITKTLLKELKKRNVQIIENCDVRSIRETRGKISIKTTEQLFQAKKVVVTSGIWTNEVLKRIDTCSIQFPITRARPKQCNYYIPKDTSMFRPENLPVFAYLDFGIYGHPLYNKKTKGVKIGFYNPPDFDTKNSKIKNIEDFVNTCMPSLKDATVVDVTEVDQCYYQMVSDDEFILGKLPGFSNIFVGCGWRGTGYKFAPLIGKILSQLALQNGTIYDITRFAPDRFGQNMIK